MSREAHVRICEGLGVKFPRATRLGNFAGCRKLAVSRKNPQFRGLSKKVFHTSGSYNQLRSSLSRQLMHVLRAFC
jgi:hypothetical protein